MAEQSTMDKLSENIGNVAREASSILTTFKGNLTRNTSQAFGNLTLKQGLRLTIIVCAYLLLRPYLLKLGAKVQQSQMEKEAKKLEAERATKMNANDLRGGKRIEEVESESEEESKEQWGKKARLRQRKVVKKAMEAQERKLEARATESDKEIEDLLED